MKNIKTKEQIEIMAKAGKILGEVLHETLKMVKPGVTEIALDRFADELITKKGGFPGFKKVKGYHHATCISVNDEVVHGIPGNRKLKEGDVVCIDTGVYVDGFHSDMAETILVSNSKFEARNPNNKKILRFLETGKSAMYAGIRQAKPGNRVGDISKAIQDIVEKDGGYSIVHSLVGHGVGRKLHEEPQIPGYLSGKIEKTPQLTPGMTIAIEVIYNMGKANVEYEGSDDWTIVTKDGSLSGVFERTIVVADNGPKLLTAFPGETI